MRSVVMRTTVLMLLLAAAAPLAAQDEPPKLLTIAESSDWRATGLHADVVKFVEALAKDSPVVRLAEMGKSFEGRSLPLVILANPPVSTPAEARASGKLVVYAQGGIHSGECCGKEALLMLARDIATTPDHPLLEHLVILFAPVYNPDGNDRVRKTNRPGQAGPVEGMGIRATAEGYDLNRDNTKLDSPEAQSLSRLMNAWDPLLVVDTHTTNGSYHQNTLTFDGPVNPAGDPRIIDFVRNTYLPAVSADVEQATGYKTTFYGNSNRDKTRWTTYDGRPRFGTRARGIRGIVSIITEAYKYAPYKDRVLCTKAFVDHLLRRAAKNRDGLRQLVGDVRKDTIAKGRDPSPDDKVAVRAKLARIPKDIVIHGWVEKVPEGATGRRRARPRPTKEKKTYRMEHWGAYEAAHSVSRPFAYLYPASLTDLTRKLEQHGIPVEPAPVGKKASTEVYRIDDIRRVTRVFQKHRMVTLKVTSRSEQQTIQDGLVMVRTGHALGNLIVYLLEPEAEDGLAAWNVLDEVIEEGKDFPVTRVTKPIE